MQAAGFQPHKRPDRREDRRIKPCPPIFASSTPPLAYWRHHGAKALVTGRLAREDDGRLKIEARLWDVAGGYYLSGQQYRIEPEHWRPGRSHHCGHDLYPPHGARRPLRGRGSPE
jgi:hypothetical protein